ncbi:thioredoxin domain-containing protein [Candidatus Kaiserbacteria bacterium]|nr:thioredoxin domain-containing protein [Candidatus Kaiserbacteria bacterium]USN88576.1 MAG: thioredoxin domain-containing protein [Candidatus Nomurabacteria bacterium]
MKNPWVIIGIICVALFGGAIWYSGSSAEQYNEGLIETEHVKGNSEASVVLLEYSDLQCPACAAFQPALSSVLEAYGDNLRFEYRHFPLPIHPHSVEAAVASEAAAQQGKFFEFSDMLFERQQEWAGMAVPQTQFVKYADELGMDVDLFRKQLRAPNLKDKVQAQFNEARELGLTGTPTFFLNGKKMEMESYQDFITQIALAVNPETASSTNDESGVTFGF